MENSKIGWTHHTWNPWKGCHKVSEECRHCYIGPLLQRAGMRNPFGGPIRTSEATWKLPHRWNRQAEKVGKKFRVFTCSIADFFHAQADRWRNEAWAIIRECTNLDFLILTKRAHRIEKYLPKDWASGYANVWLGVTVGSKDLLWQLEVLKHIPASVRFISAEPLLEPMNFRPYLSWVDWIITGCERAGKTKRRRMLVDWVEDIDKQCNVAGVPHFFKQAYVNDRGVPSESPTLHDKVVQEFPKPVTRHVT